MTKKVLLSGIKPSGLIHIGNYFGAMRQFLTLQDEYQAYIMIADLHALTTVQDAKKLKEDTLNLALDYLAIGLDPEKVVLFKQSDVAEHAELAWIFDCITDMPYLSRAHAFKAAIDKFTDSTPARRFLSSKLEQLTGVNVGLFNYPMLMAADILLYSPDIVPVGKDQKQHVEYARDTAEKFNRIFGETFKLPEPLILGEVETVPGIDGQKMSKSYGNTIPLFAEDEEIKKLCMSIVTDSSGERPENVYQIHKLFKSEAELAELYAEKKGKYKELKEKLAEDIIAFISPLRARREELAKNPEQVINLLRTGAEKAKAVANTKMTEVKDKVGINL